MSSSARGFSLLELLLAIIVLGVGLAGVLLAFNQSVAASADPLVRKQMLSVAEEMMDEIRLRSFTAVASAAPAGCARSAFNDIDDYNGYNQASICDIEGNAIASLSSFGVAVAVVDVVLPNGVAAKRITVSVSLAGQPPMTLVGYRTGWA